MSDDKSVITVAMEVGRKVMVHAEGDPAKIVGVAIVAGGAVVATAIAYGSWKYGSEATDWLLGKRPK